MLKFFAIVSCIVLALGACVVVLNWACVIANIRLRRQGAKRHVSTISFVPQLLVLISAIVSSRLVSPPIPGWVFWLVAFADPALFSILYYPVFLLRKKLGAQT